jgi:acetyl-CoA synthetase (ADP-forming)
VQTLTINKIVEKVLGSGRSLLFEDEAGALLSAAGIAVNPCHVAADEEGAVAAAQAVGYPVVLKVRSQAITHKTDVGGVVLDLKDQAAVRQGYQQIMAKVQAIDPAAQVTVQTMAPAGVELFVGMTTEAQFGPVLAFGLGGTFLELFKDTTFRMVPLKERDAWDMLTSIKGSKILEGFRGQPPVDREAIVKLILALSTLVEQTPQIKEMDLNPVFAYPGGVLAVDARVVLTGQ